MYPGDEQSGLTDPPYFDTLTVKFRGDNYEVALPYCEVANGEITKVTDKAVTVTYVKDGVKDVLEMVHADFVSVIEKAFDIKEITKLTVQLADSYDVVKIL
jgi:hypothetical protein